MRKVCREMTLSSLLRIQKKRKKEKKKREEVIEGFSESNRFVYKVGELFVCFGPSIYGLSFSSMKKPNKLHAFHSWN